LNSFFIRTARILIVSIQNHSRVWLIHSQIPSTSFVEVAFSNMNIEILFFKIGLGNFIALWIGRLLFNVVAPDVQFFVHCHISLQIINLHRKNSASRSF